MQSPLTRSKIRCDINLSDARCDLRHTRSDALSYCARRDLLLAGRAASSVAQYVTYIAAFGGWLDRQLVAVNGPRDLSRELIDAFLLGLRTSGLKRSTQLTRASAVARLLEDQRNLGLRGLPATTVVRRGELPRHEEQLPRG